MLGRYLPTWRPAPVIALTATATPIVQNDIAEQLGLNSPARFIQGFRRPNLGIEVVEVEPSGRGEFTEELLRDDARRPAIVYTPTRAQSEELAARLSNLFSCAAYHAGLDAERRRRVQEAFLAGRHEIIVATIAFGMGIDKPNIRTVIHTALPGSLEAYYQEIGRAGRDGEPSRTILLHSYADRRTHDYFFERDYPPVALLEEIFRRLRSEPVEKTVLQRQLRMDADVFDKALEKLWIHGGAVIDFAENVSHGHDRWPDPYIAQAAQKQQQLELMLRYAEGRTCRMAAIVRHFGDTADSHKPCGICDFCAPEQCIGQRFRPAIESELHSAHAVIATLREGGARSTGKLHAEIHPSGDMTRDAFEEVVGAMARAGLVRLTDERFEKDGRVIPYRKAALTASGATVMIDTGFELQMKADREAEQFEHTRRKKTKKKRKAPKSKRAPRSTAVPKADAAPIERLEDALRAWRLAEAKRRGVPAFRIFSDRTLDAIVASRPASAAELLAIPGMGIASVEKYGPQIYRLLADAR
jgi:superfamily II DNA helicase RecQ